jgi:hypothetical protein
MQRYCTGVFLIYIDVILHNTWKDGGGFREGFGTYNVMSAS